MNLQEDDQELIPTRESLLERLRKWDDHEAWRRFFDTYWRLIYRAAVTAGLRSQDAEEVVQETVVAVARHMPQFTYRPADEGGSFKSWLLNQTKWRIRDVLKKKLKTKFDVSLDIYAESPTEVEASEQVLAGNSIDQLWEAQWEETLLAAALNQLRQEVDPRAYQMFDLCALKGWKSGAVAKTLNVSLHTVYSAKHRLTRQLSKNLERLRDLGW